MASSYAELTSVRSLWLPCENTPHLQTVRVSWWLLTKLQRYLLLSLWYLRSFIISHQETHRVCHIPSNSQGTHRELTSVTSPILSWLVRCAASRWCCIHEKSITQKQYIVIVKVLNFSVHFPKRGNVLVKCLSTLNHSLKIAVNMQCRAHCK